VPALVGPIVGFALGAVLAWLCRGEAPREDEAVGRARARVAGLFGGLVFAPVCAYFVIFAGDWALFYLADSRAVPSALLLVLVVIDAVAVVSGFWAGYQAARRRADRALLALGAAPATVAAAMVLAMLPRLRVDGTFHQVSARFGTRPVAGGPLGYAVLWMGAMIVAGMVIAARALNIQNAERPRPPAPVEPAPGTPEGRPALLGQSRSGGRSRRAYARLMRDGGRRRRRAAPARRS
jgi:hypothetical protein